MKITDADELFTYDGFLRRMIPPMFGSSIFFTGIGFFSISKDSDTGTVALVLGGVFLVTLLLQMLRYQFAGRRHKELTQLYGERYVRLVEDDKIPITPGGILVLGARWAQAQRLIPEEGPRIPP